MSQRRSKRSHKKKKMAIEAHQQLIFLIIMQPYVTPSQIFFRLHSVRVGSICASLLQL
jgi:hypothetical protein